MSKSNRKLAAILFADIVGYTSLMQTDEQHASTLLRHFQNQLEEKVAQHNGRIVNFYGDGCLCTFQIPLYAVRCGMALQLAFDESLKTPVRIGIHSGTVTMEDDKIFGDSVNITSRIESMGVAGSILLSSRVRKDVKNNPDLKLQSLGSFEFKNVEEPMEVFALANEGLTIPSRKAMQGKLSKSTSAKTTKKFWLGLSLITTLMIAVIAWWFNQGADSDSALSKPALEKSIAVLPFKNDSPDKDNQYFCDGMMDEVLNHLQKIEALGVKSRIAVEPYRDSNKGFASIAKELGVNFILEGAVRKYGDQFRISTQLIEVVSGNNLWSDTYDGTFSDTIFIVQSNIAKEIASSMQVVISPDALARIDQAPTKDVRAYDYLIKGIYESNQYWHDRDKKRIAKAHEFFDKALAIQPEYLDAILRKGANYVAEGKYDKATEWAEKAIAINPEFHEGYQLLGECANFEGKTDLAIKYYEQAIEKAKDKGKAEWSHVQLGFMYFQKQEIVKGIRFLKRGLEMNETALPAVYWRLAFGYGALGDFEQAEFYLQKAVDLESSCFFSLSLCWLQLLQGYKEAAMQYADSLCSDRACELLCCEFQIELNAINGNLEEAEAWYKQLKSFEKLSGNNSSFEEYKIAYVYDQLGKTKEADLIFSDELDRWRNVAATDPKGYLRLARIQAYQGDIEAALESLADYLELFAFANEIYAFIFIDPFFSELKDDPAFKDIIQKALDEKAVIRKQVDLIIDD